ncbi:hypothetical protein TNCT_430361 [Trichonephila clavata]|uniref:Uncharacterized protein n=1 Tax=Trichonephila clavata TaxID=2740835 RepID=A0A8X6L1V5_TRICU|nr:hypothetical protein TNCT_430361 [Trichonephila clavata]
MTDQQSGFCVSKEFIKQENSAVENYENLNCCNNTTGNLCFRHSDAKSKQLMCLPARKGFKKTSALLRHYSRSFASVAVSPWTSESTSVQYIDMYEIFLGYIFAFSSGLAVMNVIHFLPRWSISYRMCCS